MKKVCDVCGKPSGIYPLCPDCFQLKDQWKIVKCEDCGKWHLINKPCDCNKNSKHNKKIYFDDDNYFEDDFFDEEDIISECIICKNEANGFLFCRTCYYKYKNKSILLQINNCKDITLLDESYEGKHSCADGHIVKSKSEVLIDNYLFYHKIQHAYEKALPIDDNEEHDLHPDFYLPEYDLYIEHWGYNESNPEYIKQKEYKLKKYKELKITLICTNEKDMANIEATLDRKLKKVKKGEIDYAENDQLKF